MCETPVLVSTKAMSLREVILDELAAKYHGFVTTEGIKDAYPGLSFYITIANFVRVDVHLPKRHDNCKAANAPVGTVHSNNERYSYPPGAHASNRDSSENFVQYKPIPVRLEQMAEHESVKKERENVQEKA